MPRERRRLGDPPAARLRALLRRLPPLGAAALLARLVAQRSSTNGQALYGLVSFGLGGSLGLVLAGVLVDRIGPRRLFLFEAAVAAAAIVPALWLRGVLAERRYAAESRTS